MLYGKRLPLRLIGVFVTPMDVVWKEVSSKANRGVCNTDVCPANVHGNKTWCRKENEIGICKGEIHVWSAAQR